jgi:hypothetical protein
MKNIRCGAYERGIGILATVVLTLIGTLGLLVANGPGTLDKYNESLRRIRDGNPKNADLTYVKDAIGELADAAGGVPIPTGPEDIIAIAATSQMGTMVEMASRPSPSPLPAGSVSRDFCSLKLDPKDARIGDWINATLTTPVAIHQKTGRVFCSLGSTGYAFSISLQSKSGSFEIPSNTTGGALTATCNVIAKDGGGTICQAAASVSIINDDLLDCQCRCRQGTTNFSCSYNTEDPGWSPSCRNFSNGPCICKAFGCFRTTLVTSGECYDSCVEQYGY